MSEVVVITSASAGLERAIVREFAREGARIGLLKPKSAGVSNRACSVMY
jgi:NAD(P)-dependent dehydrogenase (short-subunit alcohol dehydrogenase family)